MPNGLTGRKPFASELFYNAALERWDNPTARRVNRRYARRRTPP
jgi:hypothetical protein